MNSTWGNKIKYSLFGESHGMGVGITMHGIQKGLCIDIPNINKNLKRRASGSPLKSKRREEDKVLILSGEKGGYTTGSPLTFYIENKDVLSDSYDKLNNKPRPSHADFVQIYKYGSFADLRGSGHLSARLTAPIVAAGTLLRQIDDLKGIHVAAEICQIGNSKYSDLYDYGILENISIEESEKIKDLNLSIIDEDLRKEAEHELLKAIEEGDSLGSKLRFSIRGLSPGIGEPFFDSLESRLSQLLFSIPGLKAIEFGLGTDFAKYKGSSANDPFIIQGEKVSCSSNRSGGINGGISNGMPINFSLSFRPTPSISIKQKTVDLRLNKECEIEIQGRHDPCIGLRALPIVEAMCYMVIYDFM